MIIKSPSEAIQSTIQTEVWHSQRTKITSYSVIPQHTKPEEITRVAQNNETTLTPPNPTITTGLPNNSVDSTSVSASSGIPENPSVQQEGNRTVQFATTEFIDDADVVIRDETHIDHMDPQWLMQNDTQSVEQTLRSFLAKPIILNQNNFSTSDTYSFLNSYSMPYAAFTSSSGGLWLNKLLGFYGIRMDMRFKLVVNANKFQQGRYCLGWVPLSGSYPTTSNLKNTMFNNMHMATLIQRTTVPHVEIDLATETTCELLVPFVSTQSFWPLNSAISSSDTSCLGFINLYPYIPLVSPAGSTTASYTLYVSFENITLFGAASPQSGLQKRETSNKQNGPISGIASSISKGFKEFANIPVLSEVATPVSWIADRIAKTASIFGFSKPAQGDSASKMELINAPNHTTTDGDGDVRALSYLALPATTPIKGHAGTDLDEMDFSYIVRKYAYNTTTNWTTTSPVGLLFSTPVKPNFSISNSGVQSFTPLAFVSNFFRVWRGSIRYRFKFVKTEFHSGRVQFCFYPTDESALTADFYYVNRQIVDIRDNIEVEIVVPYISRFPYLGRDTQMGTLTCEVVDMLVCPATVSSTISIITEHAGGDDMEFAIPEQSFTVIPKYAVPQSALKSDKQISFTIGNSDVHANPVISSAYCIGDKVTNFRAYLKRYSCLSPNSKVAASTKRLNGSTVAMVPDAIPCLSAGTTTYYTNADMVAVVASCYGLWSGGIRLRDVFDFACTTTPANITSSNLVTAYYNDTIGGTTSQNVFTTNSGDNILGINCHMVLQTANLNNIVTVELPQYTDYLCRNVVDCIIFQDDAAPTYYNYQTQGAVTQAAVLFSGPKYCGPGTNTLVGYDLHNIYRSLADDGNFSLFISVPPVVGSGNTANANFY